MKAVTNLPWPTGTAIRNILLWTLTYCLVMNFVLHFFKVLWLTAFHRMHVLFLFILCWFESPAFQSSSSPPWLNVFEWEGQVAEPLSWQQSRGERFCRKLNFGQTKFVVCHGNCLNGEQTKFFRKRNVHTIRRCEIYCSATILSRDIRLDVGEYIR
jgi:hypothetical protein